MISPISFLILVVCVFFLFVSLARILSIVLIFFKETAFCFINFSVVFLFSVSLISTIFIISFVLLVLALFHPSFSSFLRYEILLLFSDLALFMMDVSIHC